MSGSVGTDVVTGSFPTTSNNNNNSSNNNNNNNNNLSMTSVGGGSSNNGMGMESSFPVRGERYTLEAMSELRLEIPHMSSASSQSSSYSTTLYLISGSAEIFGAEMAQGRPYGLVGGTKLAVFTWYGCQLDVESNHSLSSSPSGEDDDGGVGVGGMDDFVYVSDETQANVAYVNTHAQLEAMRDAALARAAAAAAAQNAPDASNANPNNNNSSSSSSSSSVNNTNNNSEGPRVLLAGPADTGKSSVARVLLAYAVKLGRSPLLIDLDVSQNMLSVPGTISASPMTPDSVSVFTHATSGSSIANGTTPLVFWYGSTDPSNNIDLYKEQVTRLGLCIDQRLQTDVDARTSGFIVNTSGWIEDAGYKLLLHAADALRINVILVMGHDRLYSMLTTHFTRRAKQQQQNNNNNNEDTTSPLSSSLSSSMPKIIKLPRSGGVVSRDTTFRRQCRSQSIKRYFNGDLIRSSSSSQQQQQQLDNTNTTSTTSSTTTTTSPLLVYQFAPSLLEIPLDQIILYKLTGLSLSASMLPVASKQHTDTIQLSRIHSIQPSLQHSLLAVCHPSCVELYEQSGLNSDLYLGSISGFVVVEKVFVEREIIRLLSPCAGSLPSLTLLGGDITWME